MNRYPSDKSLLKILVGLVDMCISANPLTKIRVRSLCYGELRVLMY